ncbi:MAG: class I SAM-dependent methyltransferase [Terriglobales bacterium]
MAQRHNARQEEETPTVASAEMAGSEGSDKQRLDQELQAEESRISEVYAERKRLIPTDRYSSRNPGNLFIRREIERHLLSILQSSRCQPLSSKRILDIGCGSGFWLQQFVGWGAKLQNLFGIDLRAAGIAEAKEGGLEGANLKVGSATRLGFADESFDLVMQFAVFSSVLHEPSRRRIASEMIRVLKPGGYIVWYDFFVNNPWNRDVRGLGKRELNDLFPGCRPHFYRVTVAPPFTRRMGRLAPVLYPALTSIKLCSTHYLAFLEK